jgi:hypothetical protein
VEPAELRHRGAAALAQQAPASFSDPRLGSHALRQR